MAITSSKHLKQFRQNSVVLDNDDEIQVDAVIFCTGFRQSYPFLDESCGVTVRDNLLYPTYKVVVQPHHPTLFFNGQTRMDAHFLMVSLSSEMIRNVLLGTGKLPSKTEMIKNVEGEIDRCIKNGLPLDSQHMIIRSLKWPLAICKIGNIEPPMDRLRIFQAIIDVTFAKKNHTLRTLEFSVDDEGKILVQKIDSRPNHSQKSNL